jgi:transcriptional regulator with XRE-family HTH domain/DNA-directed RNA polymerase subunit RPC12/RpoP
MDLIKIGKFISLKRKEKGITQGELAEKLYISDRAISKWENGLCLPDAGNMPLLCEILGITINDLFSGEVVDMKDTEKKLEENLLEMTKQKEEKDRQLLTLEVVLGVIITVMFTALLIVSCIFEMSNTSRCILILVDTITFVVACFFMLKIEQVAGYYECKHCHHKYVPTYLSLNIAPHMGRTRYMRCPKCNKKSWQKKVISKE